MKFPDAKELRELADDRGGLYAVYELGFLDGIKSYLGPNGQPYNHYLAYVKHWLKEYENTLIKKSDLALPVAIQIATELKVSLGYNVSREYYLFNRMGHGTLVRDGVEVK